jgi:DNA/RNA-binding domain of Phe-tRNA-synthetase-like protein
VTAGWLADAHVAPEVFALRPDYRALLVFAEDLVPGPSDEVSGKVLADAEAAAAPEDHPHVLAWREAFRAFGAKPQRTRPSVDALLRRAPEGLPRIDRLTDVYNAVSVAHAVPLGGEDVDRYVGPLRLCRATGDEPFETTAGGQPVVDHPELTSAGWGPLRQAARPG